MSECGICGLPTCEGTHMVGQPKRGTLLDAEGNPIPSPDVRGTLEGEEAT